MDPVGVAYERNQGRDKRAVKNVRMGCEESMAIARRGAIGACARSEGSHVRLTMLSYGRATIEIRKGP